MKDDNRYMTMEDGSLSMEREQLKPDGKPPDHFY